MLHLRPGADGPGDPPPLAPRDLRGVPHHSAAAHPRAVPYLSPRSPPSSGPGSPSTNDPPNYRAQKLCLNMAGIRNTPPSPSTEKQRKLMIYGKIATEIEPHLFVVCPRAFGFAEGRALEGPGGACPCRGR